jgi:hypothetical protein
MKRNDWLLALALGTAAVGTAAGVYLATREAGHAPAQPVISHALPHGEHAPARAELSEPEANRQALPSTVAPAPAAAPQPVEIRKPSPTEQPEPADQTPRVFTAEEHEQYKQIYGGRDRDGLLKARDELREKLALEKTSREKEGRSVEGDPGLAALQNEIEWLEQQVGR